MPAHTPLPVAGTATTAELDQLNDSAAIGVPHPVAHASSVGSDRRSIDLTPKGRATGNPVTPKATEESHEPRPS